MRDPRTAEVGPARRALLDYVIVLTERPWETCEAQIRRLREAGYSDPAIAMANQVAGFFAWANRTVDGLGVPLEPGWPEEGFKGPLAGP